MHKFSAYILLITAKTLQLVSPSFPPIAAKLSRFCSFIGVSSEQEIL